MMNLDSPHYAVVTERDTVSPFLSGGAILHETYLYSAQTLESQQQRACSLTKYGESVIVKLETLGRSDIEDALRQGQREKLDGSRLYAPGIWDTRDHHGPMILETRIVEARSLQRQLDRLAQIRERMDERRLAGTGIFRFRLWRPAIETATGSNS